jgi:N-acetylmuramoyl-L-alanine amidase
VSVGAAAVLLIASAAPAVAQSAAVRYDRALAREKAARSKETSVATIRAIAKYYEGIVRAYPRSGYADNALWQAAGLLQLAHERTRSSADLQGARRLLTWLKREYPTGSLARQVDGRLAALSPKPAPRRATVQAAAAPPRPTPAPFPSEAPPGPAHVPEPEKDAVPDSEPELEPEPAASTAAAVTADTASGSADPAVVTPAVFANDGPKRVDALPALALPPRPPAVEAANAIRDITHASLPKGDRVTIELGQETAYSTRDSRPNRVQIDLTDASVAAGLAERVSALGGPLLRSVSVENSAGQAARVVLELNGQPRFSTFPLYNPFRLVIDVESDDPAAQTAAHVPERAAPAKPPPALTAPPPAAPAASPPATPSSTSRGDFSLARQLGLGVSRIVIDPGHGGHDPGARANGATEAQIVLDVALRVEKLLRAQPGFEVVLTRRTNEFIPLEERTAIANRENADMFLSIHVNSSPRPATRGVETYLLDFASSPDAEALAARENASSAQAMRLLPDIVKTIALNNKLDESRELAGMVQTALVRRLSPLSKELQDLGVKRAPFVVLIGAQMPSVLAEISFLTNRTDASLLRQASHRQRIAEALADGVLRYRASLKAAPASEPRASARTAPR